MIQNVHEIHYNRQHLDKIIDLCEPLFKNLGIAYVTYDRFYDNGTYLKLNTNIDWRTHLLDYNLLGKPNIFLDQMRQIDKLNSKLIFLHDTQPKNDVIISKLQKFNIWHGVNISYRKETYVENISFATTRDQSQMTNFFLNSVSFFEDFLAYFKLKAWDIINAPSEVLGSWNPQLEYSTAQLNKSNISFSLENNMRLRKYMYSKLSFTEREIESVMRTLTGKSAKETALDLGICYRTVQGYLQSARQKMTAQNNAHLAHLFTQEINKANPITC